MKTLFSDRHGQPAYLEGMYAGAPAFLVCSGPSLLQNDVERLRLPGVLSMGVNNSPTSHAKACGDALRAWRPQLWTMTDDVASFVRSIYLDPKIIKFLPEGKTGHALFNSDTWAFTEEKVKDCPGVFFYRRNNLFRPEHYLAEETVNWGNHEDICFCGWRRPPKVDGKQKVKTCEKCKRGFGEFGGGRSVMLAAVRILYALGVRTIFLLGCDFKMELGRANYAFEQDRHKGSVTGNNKTYQLLDMRFKALAPHFDKAGLKVYNCFEHSGLRAFAYVPFAEALDFCLKGFPDVAKERTAGLYDRKMLEKKAREAQAKQEKRERPSFEELMRRVKRVG